MSKGAGRVERALRAMIEHRGGRARWFSSEAVIVAAFGPPPWKEAQRRSAMRAMHRIIDGQPGWSVETAPHHRVTFRFTPPRDVAKTKQVAAAQLLDRPTPLRQQAHKAAQQRRLRAARRADAKRPLSLAYFWTRGNDTLSAFPAALLGLPAGRWITTTPGTEPTEPRQPLVEGIDADTAQRIARDARNNVWAALAARAHSRDRELEAEPGDLAMNILGMVETDIEKAVTYTEINQHIDDADTIRALYRHIPKVRFRAEMAILFAQHRLGRELVRQEAALAEGSATTVLAA